MPNYHVLRLGGLLDVVLLRLRLVGGHGGLLGGDDLCEALREQL